MVLASSVLVMNLLAELLYRVLDPRVRDMTSPVWQRRRAAAASVWREFRSQRGGLVGLGVLAAVVLLAVTAPLFTDPADLDVVTAPGTPLQPPSAEFLLGTDVDGRSVLLLTLWGARVSLLVGFAATVLSVVIGTLVGLAAGHFGGWVASVLLRFTDFFLVLPSLVLAIALSTVLPHGVATIVLAVGVTSWPATARLVRAQTLDDREQTVRGAGPGVGWGACPHPGAARVAVGASVGVGEHDAGGGQLDHRGVDVVVPRVG